VSNVRERSITDGSAYISRRVASRVQGLAESRTGIIHRIVDPIGGITGEILGTVDNVAERTPSHSDPSKSIRKSPRSEKSNHRQAQDTENRFSTKNLENPFLFNTKAAFSHCFLF
jgi:hypothetical protein